MTKNISTIQSGGQMMWTNIVNADRKEIQYLKRKYKFLDVDLKSSHFKKFSQRPKFHVRNNYCFLILQFPTYNSKKRMIEAEEVDFFIGWDYLITIHNDYLSPLSEFFDQCNRDQFVRGQFFSGQSGFLLFEIINQLQHYCYPILDKLSMDIKNIEKNIFAGKERQMVNEILLVKRNILNLRKIMQAHKSVITKLIKTKVNFLNINDFENYFDSIIDHTKEIWDILNGQKEMIEALEATNTSLVTFKLNDIMRTLTLFSVVIFPLTLLATVFSMGVRGGMPLVNNPYGFWLIILIMFIAAIFMFIFFKRKKWL